MTSHSILEPKAIELGDLLGRPEVVADVQGIAGLINERTVLVTGAGGSIGSELCRQIALLSPRRLIITDSSEFHLYSLDLELREKFESLRIETRIVDVRDGARVNLVFQKFKPDIIFHAAALKHVPLVEANPLEAIKTNLFGTRNVANAALAAGASACVMISTDKAVNPTNIMGATKRAAEAYCQALDVSTDKIRYKTVRFGNVLGSNGSVVPRFQEQIASGGPLTVTHPQVVRFFMTIPEAVRLVLHASAHAQRRQKERGKIMVLDMGEPVRIVHLAERMIQLAGLKPYVDIDIVFTGLRPGEKLYEELFDPSEVQSEVTADGYVVASPRVIDKLLLEKSLAELEQAVLNEDEKRAIELLSHIVPEYSGATPAEDVKPGSGLGKVEVEACRPTESGLNSGRARSRRLVRLRCLRRSTSIRNDPHIGVDLVLAHVMTARPSLCEQLAADRCKSIGQRHLLALPAQLGLKRVDDRIGHGNACALAASSPGQFDGLSGS